MKEFTRFQDLFYTDTVKRSKKWKSALEKDILVWYKENFDGKFGSHSWVGEHHKYLYHYSCGTLILDIKGIGGYHYRWAIMKLHFQHWKTKEWKQGFKYGYECGGKDTGHQDDNPYSEANFFANYAWACGFSMGLKKWCDKNLKSDLPYPAGKVWIWRQ